MWETGVSCFWLGPDTEGGSQGCYDFAWAARFVVFSQVLLASLFRCGVHGERNPEEGHVCEPLHVPRRLQFWLHERSAGWSFVQSSGPQLWYKTNKSTDANFERFYDNEEALPMSGLLETGCSAVTLRASRWQHIVVDDYYIVLSSRLWCSFVWSWGVHTKVSSPEGSIVSIQRWVKPNCHLKCLVHLLC